MFKKSSFAVCVRRFNLHIIFATDPPQTKAAHLLMVGTEDIYIYIHLCGLEVHAMMPMMMTMAGKGNGNDFTLGLSLSRRIIIQL